MIVWFAHMRQSFFVSVCHGGMPLADAEMKRVSLLVIRHIHRGHSLDHP